MGRKDVMREIPGQGGDKDKIPSMKSMVPKEAIIPEDTIPPETQVGQDELDAAAKARGELIEQLG